MSIKGNQHKQKSNMLWADNVSTGDDIMHFIKKLLLIQEEGLLPTVGVVSVITKQKMLFGRGVITSLSFSSIGCI